MENLLSPDFGLTVWTLVTFGVLVWLLSRYAWRPLLEMLRQREESIQRAIEDSAAARDAAEKLKVRLEADQDAARAKAASLYEEAQADARQLREQLLAQAQADARRLAEQTREQLDEERRRLIKELEKDVSRLALQLTEKVLRQSLSDKERARLNEVLVKDLAEPDVSKN